MRAIPERLSNASAIGAIQIDITSSYYQGWKNLGF